MIDITRHAGGITVKGHAGYAPHGQDIVCTAVSTLVQTLVWSMEELTEDTIKYVMQPGTADIWYSKNLTERAQVLLDSFFVGIRSIADTYPDNVRIV